MGLDWLVSWEYPSGPFYCVRTSAHVKCNNWSLLNGYNQSAGS